MPRPVLVKLGGSLVTDKQRPMSFQRGMTKRLAGEVARAEVPAVLLHGAGSFGHPQVARLGLERGAMDGAARAGVSHVLASVGRLQAEVVQAADDAGLRPVAVPLHMLARSEGDQLVELPVGRIEALLAERHTPVLSGTMVRDADRGWRVAGADEILQHLAEELGPRLAVFATDVDGVFDRDPEAPGAKLLATLRPKDAEKAVAFAEGVGDDVTGRMRGKVMRALAVAQVCPVRIVNGGVRGRLLDTLRGRQVVGTRLGA